MSLKQQYFSTFRPNVAVSVPDILGDMVNKLDDDGRYRIRIEIERGDLPAHNIFVYIYEDRYRSILKDEVLDLGVMDSIIMLELWQIHLDRTRARKPVPKYYFLDTFERTEEEYKLVSDESLKAYNSSINN